MKTAILRYFVKKKGIPSWNTPFHSAIFLIASFCVSDSIYFCHNFLFAKKRFLRASGDKAFEHLLFGSCPPSKLSDKFTKSFHVPATTVG